MASSQRPLSETLGHWDTESSLSPGQYTAILLTPASENSEALLRILTRMNVVILSQAEGDNNESDSFVSVRHAEAKTIGMLMGRS